MSPRAACRLETLGFGEVYDYTLGKADWLACGLPSEGEDTEPTAADVMRREVLTCRPSELLKDVRERLRTASPRVCAVVADGGVLLGTISGEIDDAHLQRPAETVMKPGPSTLRASATLAKAVERMRKRDRTSMPVTTPDGVLLGLLVRDDAERALG
jgi:CBS domain-containing protein